MLEKCGDDLVAARRFMDLCRDHMSEIFSGGQIPLIEVLRRLGDIQSHAKLMRARSIYRSAQDVISDLTVHKCPQSCAASVLVLQKLIRQYEAGLSEIAPVKVSKIEKINRVETVPVYDLARQKKAAVTLSPLLKFADKEKDRDNLVTLLSLAANESFAPPNKREPAKVQKVDIILPSLTNHWLRLARTQEKSISVSSAVDDISIKTETLKALQKGLKQLGEILISQSVEKPDVRADKELSRSAHLAVTGRHTDTGFEILMSCEGIAPSLSDMEHVKTLFDPIGLKTNIVLEDSLVRVSLYGLVTASDKSIDKPVVEVAR